MIGIYKITNLITNKIYIGQSVDIERRWKQHIASSKDPNNSSYYNQLYTDFRYYGVDNFSFEILETIDKKDKKLLNELELKYMKKFDTLKSGYNIAAAAGQLICLEDIDTEERLFFSSFESIEKWLHAKNITTGKKLKHFLTRAIKNKEIIYEQFYIYYWRD